MYKNELQTIGEHITDLRKGFVWLALPMVVLFITFYVLSQRLILALLGYYGLSIDNIVSLTPFEALHSSIALSFTLTLICVVPLFLYSLYRFAKPTLDNKVRKAIRNNILISIILAISGMGFGVLVFSKLVLQALFNNYQIVTPMWGLSSLVSFIIVSGFAMGLIIQTIIIIPFLHKLGVININKIKDYRLLIAFGLLFASAIITPPDVVSQVLMFIPFYGCFELGMVITKFKEAENVGFK